MGNYIKQFTRDFLNTFVTFFVDDNNSPTFLRERQREKQNLRVLMLNVSAIRNIGLIES